MKTVDLEGEKDTTTYSIGQLVSQQSRYQGGPQGGQSPYHHTTRCHGNLNITTTQDMVRYGVDGNLKYSVHSKTARYLLVF